LFVSVQTECAGNAADVQYAEGFSEIVSYSNRSENYPDYRGAGMSYFEYFRDPRQEVTWKTGIVPEKRDTVFVFTASNGEDAGNAEFYVNGEHALTFESGIRTDKEWTNDGYKLQFKFKGYHVGNSGLYYLSVPADKVTAGEKCVLRVTHVSGGPGAWFMVKGYGDTLIYEGIRKIQPDPRLEEDERAEMGSEPYLRARLRKLHDSHRAGMDTAAQKAVLNEGEISVKENKNFWFMDSPAWKVNVEKDSGIFSRIVNTEPEALDILPLTGNGLVVYAWNKDKRWFSFFNKLEGGNMTKGRENNQPFVRFSGKVNLEDKVAQEMAELRITYTVWDDRLDIQAVVNYLKDDPSSYEFGLLQAYEPEQWDRQLVPLSQIAEYKVKRGLGRVLMRYATTSEDHTLDQSPMIYPFGILERNDRYVIYGFPDLAANAVIGVNNLDHAPSFLFSLKGITSGKGYSFNFTLKSFPKSNNTVRDVLRWYIGNMYSTDPLTRGIATYVPHPSRTLIKPGNVMLGYDAFWIPQYAPELKDDEERVYQTLNMRHFWWAGWRHKDETWPVGTDTEAWVTDMHDPKITMTTEKLQQIIKEAHEKGYHLYFYFRQIYYADMVYDDKPPFKRWMRDDKKYFTMFVGDYRNDEYRNWYVDNVKKCIDFFNPDGIAWDLSWGDELVDNHGVLRMQYEVYKWLKEKHPDKRVILNNGPFTPSALYADAVLFEGGDTGIKKILNLAAAKALNVDIVNLSYSTMFAGREAEHIHSLMRALSYGATWSGSLPSFIKHPQYKDWPSLYQNNLTDLAQFSALCNNTPLVTDSFAVRINPPDEKLTVSMWANQDRVLVAVFNDNSGKKSFQLKLDGKILSGYGWKGQKTFKATVLGSNGLPVSEETFTAVQHGESILIGRSLGPKELLILQ
jgi:hypothetical protein